jgi:hypothetical protein
MEARYIQQSAYRDKLAEEIANGIRSRGSVRNTLSSSGLTVPLQPFIDQTRVRDPDLRRKKRPAKKSKRKSSSPKKSSTNTEG